MHSKSEVGKEGDAECLCATPAVVSVQPVLPVDLHPHAGTAVRVYY